MSDNNPEADSSSPQEEQQTDDQTKPPIIIYYQDQKMENLKTGLSSKDLLIASRLEKLREERLKDVPKDNTALEKRLADLKGVDPSSVSGNKNVLFTSDTRSATEKADHLLRQFLAELQIDKSLDQNIKTDIETGLATLKGVKGSAAEGNNADSSSEDEETAAQKLVERYTEEAALKPTSDDLDSDEELERSNNDDNDEVASWCIICNEDATLKCPDCEGDAYCFGCFHKGHEMWDMNHHKPVPFNKVPK